MAEKGKSKEARSLQPDEYTVGWISALPTTELVAAKAMLDEVHSPLESQPKSDENSYTLGGIGRHNVVIACLPEYGVVSAAIVAKSMQSTFPNLRFGLMVGIGGGIPSADNDIRLGDVVVSLPTEQGGGVIQYDLGRMAADGFQRLGTLNRPPTLLRTAITNLRSTRTLGPEISILVSGAFGDDDLADEEWTYPSSAKDVLYDAEKTTEIVSRNARKTTNPRIFYGNIASGNLVIKNAIERDRIAKRDNVICFEMEAAGLMDNFPCLVIRGICDYADSHKNKKWQPYAAAVAAAYAKKLLSVVTHEQVGKLDPIRKNLHWNIPRPCNPLFTGREKILNTLRDRLCAADKRQQFVIFGMGGAGKSEVCLKFAEENRDSFWGVFWIDAGSVSNLKLGFIDAASRADGGKQKTYEDSKFWFENLTTSWLLILDNADNMGRQGQTQVSRATGSPVDEDDPNDDVIDYSKFIPSGDRGSILMTTRNKECTIYGTDGHQKFERLEIEHSTTLLLKASGIDESEWQQNRADAMNIVGENCLTQHPLAIVQAGAFIQQGLCKLKDYPAEFKAQRKVLLKHRPNQARSEYGDVYATFEVSAKALESSSKPEWHDALQLLQTLAFLDRQDVSRDMFATAWKESIKTSKQTTSDDLYKLSMWHVNALRRVLRQRPSTSELDLISLAKAGNALQMFSLISINPDTDGISMHPLVHAWAKDRLGFQERNEAWSSASSILTFSMGNDLNYNHDVFVQLQTHVEYCIGLYPEECFTKGNSDTFEVCRTFYHLVYVLYYMRRDVIAEKMAILIASRVGHEIKPHSWNWRLALYLLALCQELSGDPGAGIKLLQQVVSYDEESKLRDPSDPDRLHARTRLGIAHGRLDQNKKAILILEDVVKIREKCLASSDEDLLLSKHSLASAYVSDWQVVKGTKLLEEVINTRNTTLPRTHPSILSSQHQLAHAYIKSYQLQKAIDLLEEVVQTRKSTVPSWHPDLLISQYELSMALYRHKQYQQALPIIQTVVQIESQILKPENYDLIQSKKLLNSCQIAIETGSEGIGSDPDEDLPYQAVPSATASNTQISIITEVPSRPSSKPQKRHNEVVSSSIYITADNGTGGKKRKNLRTWTQKLLRKIRD